MPDTRATSPALNMALDADYPPVRTPSTDDLEQSRALSEDELCRRLQAFLGFPSDRDEQVLAELLAAYRRRWMLCRAAPGDIAP